MSEPNYEKSYGRNPAENYERYFVPTIGGPVAADLVEAAALRPGERVLDIACGTGIVTRLAAERVGSGGTVAGLDVAPGMLAVAREAAPPGISIDWYEAPADAIPLPDDGLDVVLCGMGLQFFSDKEAALREVRRVLAPGGRFVANLPGPTPAVLQAMDEALDRHFGAEAASFVQAVFSLHEPDELRNLATAAGFGRVSVQSATRTLQLPPPEEFLWQYIHSTPLAAKVASASDDLRAALQDDFTARCQELVEDGALTLRVNMTTVTATE